MCTSKILTWHDRGLIDCAGHNIYPDGISKSRGNWRPDGPEYGRQEETLLASGCAALYRRDAVMECGGFDEDLFAYLDDVDLGLKLRLSGFRCMYVPTAVVYHHGSASEGQSPFGKVYLIERNRVWVMLKFFPAAWVALSPIYTFWRLYLNWRAGRRGVGRAGAIARRHPWWRLAGAILRAWRDAIRRAPVMLARRRRIMAGRRIPLSRFYGDMRRFRAAPSDMAFD
jgi:GT2 family glycosyltransferase